MFLNKEEIPYHPLPDRIITSGRTYKKILVQAGFPENIVYLGKNLRFVNSEISLNNKIKQLHTKKYFLLPLTFDTDLALELIYKIHKSLYNINFNYQLLIRRHPLIKYDVIDKFIKEINLKNYQYADTGIIQDWISKSNIVITTGGSVVLLETIISGVPLLRIVPENNFFLDPIAWSNYIIKPVSNFKDIRNKIIYILNNTKYLNMSNIATEYKRNYFSKYYLENNNIFIN